MGGERRVATRIIFWSIIETHGGGNEIGSTNMGITACRVASDECHMEV